MTGLFYQDWCRANQVVHTVICKYLVTFSAYDIICIIVSRQCFRYFLLHVYSVDMIHRFFRTFIMCMYDHLWTYSIQFFILSRPVHWYLRFNISIYKCTQNNSQGSHMYSRSNKDKKKSQVYNTVCCLSLFFEEQTPKIFLINLDNFYILSIH